MTIGRRNVELFGEKHSGVPLVILNTVHGEGEEVWEAARTLTDTAFTLAAVSQLDWNDDMTPWPSPPAARWDSPYGGGADGYLEELSSSVIPAIEEETGAPSSIAIAGYSLGGLFALYSLYASDLFTSAVSASGSLWYPDFADYILSHTPRNRPERIYLSLGEKEPKSGSTLMRQVGDKTGIIHQHFRDIGIETVLEMNPGGHFTDTALRMAKGISWILRP